MLVIGYIASIVIGIALGLIGGGGSILTVPVLVYLFHVNPVVATGYSLFIVGTTSAVGSVTYFRKGLVDIQTAIIFGIPSILAVFATRHWILPMIPDHLVTIGEFELTRGILLLLVFAVLMVVASFSMIKRAKAVEYEEAAARHFNYPMIIVEGIVVGVLTGLVGAGGGFLIIPALVMLSKLPMKKAIGTSLVIIAAKSLIGFLAEANATNVDWKLLLAITGCAIVGIFIGAEIGKRIDGDKLKPAFGWFVLVMGIYIIIEVLSSKS